ncbi:DUF3574 domain-containing protein [Tahibacter amnicola]|uniref:DUF3574 domain-containing protein n=1 Tax=Tahibacter amnicola TaxID=2976241 RepID=A0ABY6BIK6_9GAMM|nr:DUF3574 domain-containing protein [Tahibacter amnicola]UXI69594.1 DUF3574 domain-containing protein [Tahibacter amnicola]
MLHGLLLVSLCGCAITPRPATSCAPGLQPHIRDVLYFGQSRPDGSAVTPEQWEKFQHDVLTSAFPEGLTVIDGEGYWRSEAGSLVREGSRLVILLHPPGEASGAAVDDVIARYRVQFQQEAVLREQSAVCVRF